jgi:hypothetical protein
LVVVVQVHHQMVVEVEAVVFFQALHLYLRVLLTPLLSVLVEMEQVQLEVAQLLVRLAQVHLHLV